MCITFILIFGPFIYTEFYFSLVPKEPALGDVSAVMPLFPYQCFIDQLSSLVRWPQGLESEPCEYSLKILENSPFQTLWCSVPYLFCVIFFFWACLSSRIVKWIKMILYRNWEFSRMPKEKWSFTPRYWNLVCEWKITWKSMKTK